MGHGFPAVDRTDAAECGCAPVKQLMAAEIGQSSPVVELFFFSSLKTVRTILSWLAV